MCDDCEQFVAMGEAYLNENETQAFVKHEIKKACKEAGDQAKMCVALLDAGLEYALEFVNGPGGTPEAVCKDAQLCSGEASVHAVVSSSAITALVVEGATATAETDDARDCLKCKFAIEAMHAAITSNDTVAHLLDRAESLCETYAARFQMDAECAALVRAYGPQLIADVGAKLADAEAVCVSIGMCPAPALGGEHKADAAVQKVIRVVQATGAMQDKAHVV